MFNDKDRKEVKYISAKCYFLRSVKKIPYAFFAFRAIQIWENACYFASCMGKLGLFYFPRFRGYLKKLVKIKEISKLGKICPLFAIFGQKKFGSTF